MDTTISGLPDPPQQLGPREYRIVLAGEWMCIDGMWWKRALAAEPTRSQQICAKPLLLTGTDWLDALRPGAQFMVKATGEQYSVAQSDDGRKQYIPVMRFSHWAIRFTSGGWQALPRAFPNGHEDLSDETCEILHKGIKE